MVQKSSSTAQQRKIAENAHKVHDWPEEAGDCTPEAWAIYSKNQKFRAFQDWLPGDLIELARLSVLQEMVVQEMNELRVEGVIVLGGKHGDQPVENPRSRAISTLNSTINNTMRRLGLTVMAVADKRAQATRRGAQAAAESKTGPFDDAPEAKPVSGGAFLA